MLDLDIIKLAQNGNEEALEKIFLKYKKIILKNNYNFF